MDNQPEHASSSSSSSSSSPSPTVPIHRESSEAGTSSSSSSSQVRPAEELHGGRFPASDRPRSPEREEQRIGNSYGGGNFRVFDDEVSSAIGDDTWSCVIVLLTFWFFGSCSILNAFTFSLSLRRSISYQWLLHKPL